MGQALQRGKLVFGRQGSVRFDASLPARGNVTMLNAPPLDAPPSPPPTNADAEFDPDAEGEQSAAAWREPLANGPADGMPTKKGQSITRTRSALENELSPHFSPRARLVGAAKRVISVYSQARDAKRGEQSALTLGYE